jgi:hypothetical protein
MILGVFVAGIVFFSVNNLHAEDITDKALLKVAFSNFENGSTWSDAQRSVENLTTYIPNRLASEMESLNKQYRLKLDIIGRKEAETIVNHYGIDPVFYENNPFVAVNDPFIIKKIDILIVGYYRTYYNVHKGNPTIKIIVEYIKTHGGDILGGNSSNELYVDLEQTLPAFAKIIFDDLKKIREKVISNNQ